LSTTLDALKMLANLKDLVAESVDLTKRGHEWFGQCPFHADGTASLSVHEGKGVWLCRGAGCGVGGDVFHWVMQLERCTFSEAVQYLCRRYGISEPEWSPEQQREYEFETMVQQLLTAVAAHLQLAFDDSPGERYLVERGISSDTSRAWGVGWAAGWNDSGISSILKQYDADVVTAAGVTPQATGGMWEDRVILPMGYRGRVHNLYGRSARPRDYYANDGACDADKHRYLKGRPRIPFGLDGAGENTVVVEAVIDAMSVAEAGLPAVAVGGKASEEWLEALLRWTRGTLVIGMDADEDINKGPKAAVQLAASAAAGGRHSSIVVWGHKDPNAVLQGSGVDGIKQAVAGAMPPMEYRVATGLQADVPGALLVDEGGAALSAWVSTGGLLYRIENIDNHSDAKGVRATLRAYDTDERQLNVDSIGLYSSISRKRFANAALDAMGKQDDPDAVRDSITADVMALEQEVQAYFAERTPGAESEDEDEDAQMTDDERGEALAFLQDPQLIQRVAEDAHELGIVGEEMPVLVTYLAMTSRKMLEPLYLIFKAESSAGKSYLLTAIAELCPPEDLRNYTRITPQALFYCDDPDNYLRNKFLIVSERPGAEDADFTIRTMLSEKGLSLLATEKEGDKLVSRERVIRGPMAYAETTTALDIHAENTTRLVEIYMDESREHTAKIHERQRWEFTLAGQVHQTDRDAIQRKHRNAQRLLRPLLVVLPFAEHLTFPDAKPRTRRDQRKFLSLISTVAFMHQYRKDVKTAASRGETIEYIEADLADYVIAYELARQLFATTLDEMDKRTRDVYNVIYRLVWNKWKLSRGVLLTEDAAGPEAKDLMEIPISRREVRDGSEMAASMCNECIMALVDAEFLTTPGGRQGQAYQYFLQYMPFGDDMQTQVERDLVAPETLQGLIEGLEA